MRGWKIVVAVVVAAVVSVMTVVEVVADPLFLTPLINSGQLDRAVKESRVESSWTGDVESYAGYITVDQTYNNNLFFWFFPAKANPSTAPLLLWLNGGPGFPSTIGVLLENGPFRLQVNANGYTHATTRGNTSWTERFNMLYVDSPVGAGYSFTTDEAGMATKMEDVVTDLYELMTQFYTMFPSYQSNDLYTGGQSYAGKYVPALAKYIHDRNQESPEIHFRLKGVYIGGGMCDAETMFPVFPDSLYYTGLISNKTRHEGNEFIKKMIRSGTDNGMHTLMNVVRYFAYAQNATEYGDTDNLQGSEYAATTKYGKKLEEFLNRFSTRHILHVNYASGHNYNLNSGYVSAKLLVSDLFVHTREENAFLMNNYKVLHYTGNMDMTVSVAMTEAFLSRVDWTGREEYSQCQNRRWWSEDGHMRGWFAQVKNFTRVIVRNAGHNVPYGQPEAALEMMTNFVLDRPFIDDSYSGQ